MVGDVGGDDAAGIAEEGDAAWERVDRSAESVQTGRVVVSGLVRERGGALVMRSMVEAERQDVSLLGEVDMMAVRV